MPISPARRAPSRLRLQVALRCAGKTNPTSCRGLDRCLPLSSLSSLLASPSSPLPVPQVPQQVLQCCEMPAPNAGSEVFTCTTFAEGLVVAYLVPGIWYLVQITLGEQMTEAYREALFAGVAPHQLHVHSPERLGREARSTPGEPHEAALIFSAHRFDYLHEQDGIDIGTESASGTTYSICEHPVNPKNVRTTSKELRDANNVIQLARCTDECSPIVPFKVYR